MSENGLFLLWQNARDKEAEIMEDIRRNFIILDITEIQWTDSAFPRNLQRFYGEKLIDYNDKESHIGKGSFLLIVVRDDNPKYDIRKTSSDNERVNTNFFDKKTYYREITGGGHKVHSTNDEREFKRDIYLLTGNNIKYYDNKDEYAGSYDHQDKDLFYNDGFDSLIQIFEVLNNIYDYIVLRNFEKLPYDFTEGTHGDIDLLFDSIKSKSDAVFILGAINAFPNDEERVHYSIKVNDKDIFFDFRYIGDKYYCNKFEKDLLENKYYDKQKKIYIPTLTYYFYSLIYHTFIHKAIVNIEYLEKLYTMAIKLKISDLHSVNDKDGYLSLLYDFMSRNDYIFERPMDFSVFYNYDLANLNTSYSLNFDIPLTDQNNYENEIINYIEDNKNYSISANSPWSLVYHLSSLRESIINWYNFKKDSSVL